MRRKLRLKKEQVVAIAQGLLDKANLEEKLRRNPANWQYRLVSLHPDPIENKRWIVVIEVKTANGATLDTSTIIVVDDETAEANFVM